MNCAQIVHKLAIIGLLPIDFAFWASTSKTTCAGRNLRAGYGLMSDAKTSLLENIEVNGCIQTCVNADGNTVENIICETTRKHRPTDYHWKGDKYFYSKQIGGTEPRTLSCFRYDWRKERSGGSFGGEALAAKEMEEGRTVASSQVYGNSENSKASVPGA